MGGQSSSSTERSTTSYAPWIQEGQQDVAGAGFHMAEGLLYASPFARAAQTADQRKAFDLARLSARPVYEAGGPAPLDASTLTAGAPSQMQASQVTRAEIEGGMNPYLRNVMGTATDAARREYQNADAGVQSKYAASGGFGGSGEAIARGQLARGHAADSQQMAAKIAAEGFENAQRMALANAQLRQQAAAANQGAANQYGLAGMDARIKAPQINSQLLDAQQRRELTAANAILQGGNQQQQFAQGNLDAPWVALAKLQGLIPQVYDSNKVTHRETESDAGIGGLLGGFGSLLGAVSRFSDEREKTDITKLGKDPKTGLDMYAYRYNGDPKSYPKVVGPMAQDIEKRMPEAVTEYGGKKVIDMGLLRNMQEKKR
jgi:hypothetical protein